jgi:hypothetical protein
VWGLVRAWKKKILALALTKPLCSL